MALEFSECPDCGGKVYDNRAKNAERIAAGERPMPDFKCQACEWKKWPPRPQGSGGGKGNFGGPRKPAEPRYTWKDLQTYYKNSVVIAKAVLAKEIPEAEPADIIAGTATVFSAATRDGIKPEPTP